MSWRKWTLFTADGEELGFFGGSDATTPEEFAEKEAEIRKQRVDQVYQSAVRELHATIRSEGLVRRPVLKVEHVRLAIANRTAIRAVRGAAAAIMAGKAILSRDETIKAETVAIDEQVKADPTRVPYMDYFTGRPAGWIESADIKGLARRFADVDAAREQVVADVEKIVTEWRSSK